MDLGTTLIQCDLILISYICKDPLFQDHILRFWVDMNFRGILFNKVRGEDDI